MNMSLLRIFATARSIRRAAPAGRITSGAKFAALLIACCILPIGLGCATTSEPPPGFAAPEVRITAEPPGFETPPELVAADIVPAELMSGPHHKLEQRVINDGYSNHYLVVSDFGDFPAVGMMELEARVQEVQAIATLREMNRGEAYGKGVADGAKRTVLSPVRQVKRYVKNPLHIVEAVPGEAMRLVGIVEDIRKLARMGLSKAYLKDLIGYEDARKSLAKQLSVDHNSPNPVLRADLNRAAWPYYGGSAPMYLLEEFVPLVPIPHVALVAGGESLGDAVEIFSDEVGNKSLRTQLRRMGVEKTDRKALKKHDAYSSRDRKNLVRALYRVKGAEGRAAYVSLALEAETPEDARAMVRQAQTIGVYDATYDDIVEVARAGDAVLCYTRSGVVMMPLHADHVAWTEGFARRVDAMTSWHPAAGDVEAREIWVAGEFTPWAQRELESRTVAVHEHAIDVLTQALHEMENGKNGIWAKLRRNKAGRAIERLADAAD